jgi:hypothetical protein
MKKLYVSFLTAALSLFSFAQTLTFNYTGSVQTYTVPPCVTSITVDVYGAEGGQSASVPLNSSQPTGKGGRVQATIPVNPGDVLYIYVGGKGGDATPNVGGLAGYNGGGTGGQYPSYNQSASGGGGGASDIRKNGTALSNRIVVAGGAGGSGTNCAASVAGGNGGGLTGGNGAPDCTGGNTFGFGGTQSAGGMYGVYGSGDPGLQGGLGFGANSNTVGYSPIGGAGGSGYYGGGSGSLGGGGGGSSYTDPSSTGVVHTQGFQTGNGVVMITPGSSTGVPAVPGTISGSAVVCSGSTGIYSISPVSGATSYTWTVPSGTVINSGQGTTSINVTFGSNSGNISVTANNACGSSAPNGLAVTVDQMPVVNLGPNITQCGTSVVLNAGNPGASYLWSSAATTQTINVNISGTYSVVVTSPGGCSASGSVNVTLNTPPVVNLGPDITQCGGTVLLDANNPGSMYSWSDGSTTQTITISSSGAYSVVVTDMNGCTASDIIDITIFPNPVVTLTLNPSTVCLNTPVYALTGGSPPGGNYSGPGVTAGNFDASSVGAGTYTIIYSYSDPNGCSGFSSQQLNVSLCTGAQEIISTDMINIYPNPFEENLNVILSSDVPVEMLITNTLGEVVGYQLLVLGKNLVDTHDFANGIYFLHLKSEAGMVTKKLVKQK